MSCTRPAQPRLADHVAARRHRVSGTGVVVLHDTRAGGVVVIGEREWALLSAADGSRDLAGIVAVAAQRGGHADQARLAELLDALAEAGMLAAGVSTKPPSGRAVADGSRPVVPLPDFLLRCHGAGSCCRLYPTTSFSPLELARARVVAPEVLDLGHDPRRAFTPERGSELAPWHGSAAAMVDGRCAFLSPEMRCLLHERGGAQAKPRGCSLYPATLVDDGREVRVSVAPECACVFDSIAASDGVALLEPGVDLLEPTASGAPVSCASHLDAHIYVAELPAEIELDDEGARWPRERYLGWLERLEQASGETADAAALLWSAAEVLDRTPAAVDIERVPVAEPLAAPGGERLAQTIVALQAALERRLRVDGWRASGDLARQIPRWMLEILPRVDGREAVLQPQAEHLYLRALLHGRTLVVDGQRVVPALRRRALRLLVARRLARLPALIEGAAQDAALRWPLALVEAYSRGFGLV